MDLLIVFFGALACFSIVLSVVYLVFGTFEKSRGMDK